MKTISKDPIQPKPSNEGSQAGCILPLADSLSIDKRNHATKIRTKISNLEMITQQNKTITHDWTKAG